MLKPLAKVMTGVITMKCVRLRWADGHEERRDDLPAGDTLRIPELSGRFHIFKGTDEDDEDAATSTKKSRRHLMPETPDFDVTWADGAVSTVVSNSKTFEPLDHAWFWFFKFGKAIVAVRCPDEVREALLPATRYPLLISAMTEWATWDRAADANYELTLTASWNGHKLRVD